MKRSLILLAFMLWSVPACPWSGDSHQLIMRLAPGLVERDTCGKGYDLLVNLLEKNMEQLKSGVIAPDNDWDGPVPPTLFHGWDAFHHVDFEGRPNCGAYFQAKKWAKNALDAWKAKDYNMAFYYLGGLIHFAQDTSFCGHSHIMVDAWKLDSRNLLLMHHQFEEYVEEQTRDKGFEELKAGGWSTDHGGIYQYRHWWDEDGQEHWPEDLAGWVDVAAHLSEFRFENALPSVKKEDPQCYKSRAQHQFLLAQRVTAGILVDFFKEVGVIEEPPLYFLHHGETWKLENGQEEPAGEVKDPWPVISPDGEWRIEQQTAERYSLGIGRFVTNYFVRQFTPSPNEPLILPPEIGKVFFWENQTLAVIGKDEGDNWHEVYLVPRDWGPDVCYWIEGKEIEVVFKWLDWFDYPDSQRDLRIFRVKHVILP